MPSLNEIMSKKEQDKKVPRHNVEMIHYSRLIPSEDNRYSMSNIAGLANMILLAGGVKENLLARKVAPEQYEIISGHRRREAVKYLVEELGYEEYAYLPVRIERLGDIMAKIDLHIASAGQRKKTDYDLMLDVVGLTESLELLRNGGEEERACFCKFCESGTAEEVNARMLREIVARKLGLSVTKTANLKHIEAKLEPELKDRFQAGEIGISAANEAAGLPPDAQKEIAKNSEINLETVKAAKERTAEERIQTDERPTAEEDPQMAVPIEGHATDPIVPPPRIEKGQPRGCMAHRVRIDAAGYDEIVQGDRLFYLTKNDQDFRVGDDLEMERFENGHSTNMMIDARITCVQEDRLGLKDQYCIIGFKIMDYSL